MSMHCQHFLLRTAQPCRDFQDWWISTVLFVLNDVEAAPPQKIVLLSHSPCGQPESQTYCPSFVLPSFPAFVPCSILKQMFGGNT